MADHGSAGVNEAPQTIELHVVSPSAEAQHLRFPETPVNTSVRELKRMIQGSVASRPPPDRQRLIYQGKPLVHQEVTIGAILGSEAIHNSDTFTFHLVLPPTDPTSTPNTQAASNVSTQPTTASAGIAPVSSSGGSIPQAGNEQNYGQQRIPLQGIQGRTVPQPPFLAGTGIFSGLNQNVNRLDQQARTDNPMQPHGSTQEQHAEAQGGQNNGSAQPQHDSNQTQSRNPTHSTVIREGQFPGGQFRMVVNQTTTAIPINRQGQVYNGQPLAGPHSTSGQPHPSTLNLGRPQVQAHATPTFNFGQPQAQAPNQAANPMIDGFMSNLRAVNGFPAHQEQLSVFPANVYLLSGPSGYNAVLYSPTGVHGSSGITPAPGQFRFGHHDPNAPTPSLFGPHNPTASSSRLFNPAFHQPYQPATSRPGTTPTTPGATGHHPTPPAGPQGLPPNPQQPVPPAPRHPGGAHDVQQPLHEPPVLAQGAQEPAAQQQQQPQQNEAADLIRLLMNVGGNIWVAVRLLGFIWLVTHGSSWMRTLVFGFGALFIFLAQTGALMQPLQALFAPVRGHLEGLLRDDEDGEPAGPGEAGFNAGTGPGATGTGNSRPSNMPTPEEVSARLLRQQRDASWIRRGVRRAERAVVLFAASLVPGVGELHVQARERTRRRRERQAAEREVEERRRQEEAGRATEESSQPAEDTQGLGGTDQTSGTEDDRSGRESWTQLGESSEGPSGRESSSSEARKRRRQSYGDGEE